MSEEILRAALWYADANLPVFPCRQDKAPLTKNGYQDATCDADQIKRWWERWPTASIGMPTGAGSGRDVLDVDPRHGGNFSLEQLQRKYGALPVTLESKTGGGGRHLFFSCPSGVALRCSAGVLGAGLDIRADGGYVIVPPSRHTSGNRYEWANGVSEVAEMPEWLLRLALNAQAKPTAGPPEGKLVPHGAMHPWLLSRAGSYRRAGDEERTLCEKLLIDYRTRCEGPHNREDLIVKMARDVCKRWAPAETAAQMDLSDSGNATYVEECYPGRFRYQRDADIWYVADEDQRWWMDEKGEVLRLIEKAMLEKYAATAKIVDKDEKTRHRHALRSCDAVKISHCAQVLRSRDSVAIRSGEFDCDPWLLGTQNAILDLRNGKVKPPSLAVLVAKRAPVRYEPEAKCPHWDEYLEKVQPEEATRKLLAQIFGSCLTGIQTEKCFLFFLGEGGNGKSVFMRMMQETLGEDYAFVCRKALIFQPNKKAGEQAASPNDIADCAQKRLITAAEQQGRKWNLEFIKDYTGGEKQHARQLYTEGRNIVPTGKIVVPANEEPGMDEFTEAVRRRFALIEWPVTLTENEKQPFEPFIEYLKEDLSGILNWALDGLAALRGNNWKLALPASAEEATREYLNEQDQVRAFLEVIFETDGDPKTGQPCYLVSEMYKQFKSEWLEEEEFVMNKNKFTRQVKKHYGKKRVVHGTDHKMIVRCLRLREQKQETFAGMEGQ